MGQRKQRSIEPDTLPARHSCVEIHSAVFGASGCHAGGGSMNVERCMCGATDCPRCYPGQRSKPTARHYELALESVVEAVMDYGQWPHKGKAEFDLYENLYKTYLAPSGGVYVIALPGRSE